MRTWLMVAVFFLAGQPEEKIWKETANSESCEAAMRELEDKVKKWLRETTVEIRCVEREGRDIPELVDATVKEMTQ
jgi:hypothetical protein